MVLVRQGYLSDADAVAKVYVETWRTTYAGLLPDRVLTGMRQENHRARWLSVLQRSGETVLVAEEGKSGVVGFVSFGPVRDGVPGYDAEIYTLYVAPDYQNRGIGNRLLRSAFRRMAERGLHGVMLWVLARNPSRFFYEAVGGIKMAQRRERLWGVVLPEIAYGWPDLTRALNRSSDGARAG
ncbi:MAG TPA: GNAT family N-acetyltransferase [Alphaproteobacteria bacterium]|nr:GNAT family N-acetyltransferase [Alphaproteobacteria bacterium]